MPRLAFVILLLFSFEICLGQSKRIYKPSIQTCDCNFKIDSSYLASAPSSIKSDSTFPYKIDSSFKAICAYLIVPENRKKSSSKLIKLPFIFLQSKNPDKKKDPLLFTTGGPGGSSLGWINGMEKSSVIESRDCIAFEQRGTHFAIPNLRSFELDVALRESYRKNLNKDSMWLVGVKRYKKKLVSKSIDLSGYNTDETVTDIIDLLSVLKIDSVNLFGGSYSGGLMLAVLKKAPSKVRSLVLDSPLPNFVPIDEDEPMNFLNAIQVLSAHCKKDSADARYGDLNGKFISYFNSIRDKKFHLPYVEKGAARTFQIEYTKNELLDVICSAMQNSSALRDVPFMILEIVNGNHGPYIKKKLDDIFNRNIAPNGMRMSVYCADQSAYHRQEVIGQMWQLHPFLKGFHINDVYKEVCACWTVPPLSAQTKQPYYSNTPVLMGDGEMDPACTPIYISLIKHYMPNAQSFLFINKSHGVGGSVFREMTQRFLDEPYKKIESPGERVVAY